MKRLNPGPAMGLELDAPDPGCAPCLHPQHPVTDQRSPEPHGGANERRQGAVGEPRRHKRPEPGQERSWQGFTEGARQGSNVTALLTGTSLSSRWGLGRRRATLASQVLRRHDCPKGGARPAPSRTLRTSEHRQTWGRGHDLPGRGEGSSPCLKSITGRCTEQHTTTNHLLFLARLSEWQYLAFPKQNQVREVLSLITTM